MKQDKVAVEETAEVVTKPTEEQERSARIIQLKAAGFEVQTELERLSALLGQIRAELANLNK